MARWDWVWADWVHACCLQPPPELGCDMYGAAEFLGLMGNSGPSFGFVHSMAKKKNQAELSVCLSTKWRQRLRESPERNEIIAEVSIHLPWAVFPEISCSLSYNWNYFWYSKSKVFSVAVKSCDRLLADSFTSFNWIWLCCHFIAAYQRIGIFSVRTLSRSTVLKSGHEVSLGWDLVSGDDVPSLTFLSNLRDRQSAFYATEVLRSR